MNGGRQLGVVLRDGDARDALDGEPAVGPVPLLEDLPALFGLAPLVAGPDPVAANDVGGTPAGPAPRARRGRPVHAPTVPFSVRFTPEERALVVRAALLRVPGKPVSVWARAALVEVARQVIEAEDGPSASD